MTDPDLEISGGGGGRGEAVSNNFFRPFGPSSWSKNQGGGYLPGLSRGSATGDGGFRRQSW